MRPDLIPGPLQAGYGNRLAPNYVTLPGILSPEECERLIARFDTRELEDGGLVGEVSAPEVRRADLVWLDADRTDQWVLDRMMRLVADANRDIFDFLLGGFDEALQLTRYRSDALGHYDWHSDRGGNGFSRFRKLSVVVQLSVPESYEGGDLEINATGVIETMPRDRGMAILFPSYALHRVTPVTRGTRHSLVTWVHGPNFR